MKYMTSIVEGNDYFYYECSECPSKVVTLRKHDHVVQCSILCQEKHLKRIKQTFATLNKSELELEFEPMELEETI